MTQTPLLRWLHTPGKEQQIDLCNYVLQAVPCAQLVRSTDPGEETGSGFLGVRDGGGEDLMVIGGAHFALKRA